ncbi:MAG: BlaI/MecI/CopY family transcriptional regulator [Oscillospiraceae bacterium]|nr:BlaI/MecI/CopY family transcriptional regulator [Oscillospiraceae bacterium]
MAIKSTKLGDGEFEVMQAIWDAGEPVTASDILEKVQEKRTWGLSTLMTVLARLIEKGYLSCDKSTRSNIYSAVVQEKDYKKREGRSFLEKMYGNSISGFVSCLYDGGEVSDDELEELKRFIEKAGGEE